MLSKRKIIRKSTFHCKICMHVITENQKKSHEKNCNNKSSFMFNFKQWIAEKMESKTEKPQERNDIYIQTDIEQEKATNTIDTFVHKAFKLDLEEIYGLDSEWERQYRHIEEEMEQERDHQEQRRQYERNRNKRRNNDSD